MKPLRRSALGSVFAAFVYLAYACATGSEQADVGGDGDGGIADAASDAKKDGSSIKPSGDSGVEPTEDSGPGCVGKVLVNELQTAGATADDEFVEIYNPQACAISLGAWKLSYRASSDNAGLTMYSFPIGSQIAAKSFLLLGSASYAGKKDATLSGTSMSATAGQVALLDAAGKTIDGVGYGKLDGGTYVEGAPAPAPATKSSIGRKQDGVDTDDNAADWKTFATPTPGVSNQ